MDVFDALVLCQLLVENARLRGDSVSEVSAELERLWLEFAYVRGEVAA